ncbi:MAG: NAD(P)H-dependent oxidoreductase subunit E [candidate division Zixibacteria bacterium]|nr:NAD(P)H-dependent oxidoreductase subunit E [candidate division Zixibacteria bacterium]
MLSEAAQKRIAELKDKYPQKRSAILPAMHVVLEEVGFYNRDILKQVSELLGLSEMEVTETLSFYTYFPKQGVGKYHIQVCSNVSCMLLGAEQLVKYLEEKLKIKIGETTSDGLFTLSAVECLGSCGTAPVMQINQTYYENLTKDKVDQIIEELKKEK